MKNLFEERKMLVVVVHFELDKRTNLLARVRTGGNVCEVMDYWRHLWSSRSLMKATCQD